MKKFEEIFKNSTDLYIFRIIDQLTQINFDSSYFKNSFPAEDQEFVLNDENSIEIDKNETSSIYNQRDIFYQYLNKNYNYQNQLTFIN